MTINFASISPHLSAQLASIKEPDPRTATTVFNESTVASSELHIPIEVELPRPGPSKSALSHLLVKFAAEKLAPAEERFKEVATKAEAVVHKYQPAVTRLVVGKDAYEFMNEKRKLIDPRSATRQRVKKRDYATAAAKAIESRSFLFDPIGWVFRKNVVAIGNAFLQVQQRFFHHVVSRKPAQDA